MSVYAEQIKNVIDESKGKTIVIADTGKKYPYGQNPWADMLIENCVFCDTFPEEVESPNDYYGFNRSLYEIM